MAEERALPVAALRGEAKEERDAEVLYFNGKTRQAYPQVPILRQAPPSSQGQAPGRAVLRAKRWRSHGPGV